MMYLAAHVLTGLAAYAFCLWLFRDRHDTLTMYNIRRDEPASR